MSTANVLVVDDESDIRALIDEILSEEGYKVTVAANAAAARAHAATLESELHYSRLALAEREWSANNVENAARLLAQTVPKLRSWEYHFLKRQVDAGVFHLAEGNAMDAAFSPQGTRIALAMGDGSVQTISYDIDPITWNNLADRRDGVPLPPIN